jgi:glycine dehydrogenase
MLGAVGVAHLDDLIDQALPASIRLEAPLTLPPAEGEFAFLNRLRQVAARNKVLRSFIGLGYYDCITPSVILRNVFENPSWYTPYTPYQAEIAQGRLEALLNYQTMVRDLTGMEVANASLLDEPTAAAEAMTMLRRLQASKNPATRVFLVADTVWPQTLEVLLARAEPLGIDVQVGPPAEMRFDAHVFGALLQYPDGDGRVADYGDVVAAAHAAGVLVAVAADLLSLVLLAPPGEWGADVVVGSAQRFGVPLGYGGPHAAFFATREAFVRQAPGRIIGVSVDAEGTPAYRMALQTREQHIRREKATSNICTAQALLANLSGFYAVYHGPDGLRAIASRVHAQACALAEALTALDAVELNGAFFDTLKLAVPGLGSAARVRKEAEAAGLNFRSFDDGSIGIALDETVTDDDLQAIVGAFARALERRPAARPVAADARRIPPALVRRSAFLTHPVFNSHHSETQMMRYLKTLERRDIGLDTSMIPLGSCTMKLNAATEMMPVTWPAFARLHPFAPADQADGYRQVFRELEATLCEVTGLAAVSLQPNSGAQGELTGLLVIRAWHRTRGDAARTVVLIPSSAHGTNPASAVMAGLKVVVVACDAQGNIDVGDLRAKAEQHRTSLAALMVTYPSTHGVFEDAIREICDIVHAAGGQVYMDGANLNAQVGLTSPARIGADVCHLNLHKTFSIPHGGGGPGMGPIAVAAHLAPFLPRHPLVATGGAQGIRAVAGAPWGSASILLISYAYARLLGATGMTDATRHAILNANYLKATLEPYYPVLYARPNGRVAHELIFDLRPFRQAAGIDEIDVAKRLMDYGFHAPTVSFPVPGTLMVEPTESEGKDELDRFCEAMVAIRAEIQAIADGTVDRADNPLKHAPHTAAMVSASVWPHAYSREQAAYPLPYLRAHKVWPAIARIDNAYGDRHLVCACVPVKAYADEPVEA